MIALTSGEIHLWLADYDEINDEQLHSAYRAILNEEEKRQEPRFYFAKDRRRYLVTRALVRTVLAKYAPVAPADWKFTNNAYGRPETMNAEASDLRMTFNISHAHSLIVLGVTPGRALGVDVENVVAREVSIDIADRFFSPAEVTALAAMPPHRQQDRFFEYWTFKESYIKARGMGLSLPLDKFSFQFPQNRTVEISIHTDLADDASRWQFWQFRPTPEYVIAVCAEHIDHHTPTLVIRKAIPMMGEELLAPVFTRTSQ